MPLASIGTAIWGLLKKLPPWVWWFVLLIVFWKWTDMSAYTRGKKDTNAKRDKESAQVESEVVSQITENSNELVRESDAVRSHSAATQLPDGTATLPDYHFRDR